MTAVLEGVTVLEVAEHTFVPAASALLADWGATVVKIEPIERGDAIRGLAATGVVSISGGVHAVLEHSNRGKRSLALDLTTPEGLEIYYKLAASADVFLTNKLPRVRTKLKIEPDDIRAHNPNIIYVARTGQGERGPDADKGSYDSLSFWFRAGVSIGVKPADSGPAAGQHRAGLRRLHRGHDHRWGDHGACSTASGPARPPRSTSRCSGPGCGPWARPRALDW